MLDKKYIYNKSILLLNNISKYQYFHENLATIIKVIAKVTKNTILLAYIKNIRINQHFVF